LCRRKKHDSRSDAKKHLPESPAATINGQNTAATKKEKGDLKAFLWSGAEAEQGIYPIISTASMGKYTSLMTGQYTTIPSSAYVVDPPVDTKVSRSLLAGRVAAFPP